MARCSAEGGERAGIHVLLVRHNIHVPRQHRLMKTSRLLRQYTDIRTPVLAIFANPRKPGPYAYNTPAERAKAVAWETAGINGAAAAFQAGVPLAHVVQIAQSNHFVFLSNEADVLHEMRSFL